MGHILSHPVSSKNLQRFGDARGRAGVAEMQGYRTNMEDGHNVTLKLPNHPNITYIGMFDGHNGAAAAEYMAKNLHTKVNSLSKPTDHSQLKSCIEQIDATFMEDTSVRAHGCTACIALITHDGDKRKLTVANVGDSRTLVISADGKCKFTTVDHKPDVEGETQRILAAGGSVQFGRVDGDLAMSRSIGDYAYKNVPNVSALEQKVIPTPEIFDYELAADDLVVVCCDGLVEKTTNEQVAEHVHQQVQAQKASRKKGDLDPALIMASLLDWSLAKGSKDNMSSVLWCPGESVSYGRADEYVVGPFSEWSSDRGFVDAFIADARKHGYTQEQVMQMVAESNAKKGDNNDTTATSSTPSPKVMQLPPV